MNKKGEFWDFLLHGTLDAKTGVYSRLLVHGTHCGNCLAKAIMIAKKKGVLNPILIETCRLDNIEEYELPEEANEINSDIFMLPTLHAYKLKEEEEVQFTPPTGIAFGTGENDYEIDLIKECFVAYAKNKKGIFEMELVADNCRLRETFFKAIYFLPDTATFWIYIKDHWGDCETELFARKDLNSKKSIIEFLKTNNETILKNGFIDIVIHSEKGKTSLTLNEHKKIQLHTKEETIFNSFISEIIQIGFQQTKDYYNIEFGYHHWHYRTDKSMDRDNFKKLLKNNNFEQIILK